MGRTSTRANRRKGKKMMDEKIKEEYRWSCVDGNVDTVGRYLCVSNGYEIWCLDLKQSKQRQGVVPLPKIASLNLLGEQLPASVGLFNSGSHAYMIGGQDLPTSLKGPLDPYFKLCWGVFPSPLAINRYKSLCKSWGIKGSSCVTYRLTLAEDGTFSASKACEFEELNNPKVWPIVEHINGQLHVVDAVPFPLDGCRDWIFSHEVCNFDVDSGSGGWEDISTIEETQHINSHVVVGDLIFAVTHEGSKRCYYLEFDSRTRIWKGCTAIKREWKPALELKHVWNILAIGTARCAGEFPCGGIEPAFVLIAIVRDYGLHDFVTGTQAVAYLVTMTGRVICHQHLPDFFKGPLHPCDVIARTIIQVEGGVDGAMCSVVSGTLLQDGRSKDHLFINTFSVEMLTSASAKVREILVEKASEVEEASPAVDLQFVRVALKDKFIYDTGNTLDVDGGIQFRQFDGWRACFLTPGPCGSSSSCKH